MNNIYDEEYDEENFNIVRCNWCEHIFRETSIPYDNQIGTEYCPECGKIGALMDMDDYTYFEEEDEKRTFRFLAECRDWQLLKESFKLEILCDFENEIHDYNYYKNGYENFKEGFPAIINWYEGNISTEDLIKEYKNKQEIKQYEKVFINN